MLSGVRKVFIPITVALVAGTVQAIGQTRVPTAPWPAPQAQAILDRTSRTVLAPDLSHLTPGERVAVAKLLKVGRIFQDLYEEQRHRDALPVRTSLEKATDLRSRTLLTLYQLNQGPIATTLDNKRQPFLAVDPAPPGKNVYPWDLGVNELQDFIAAHPDERAPLTHLRHVVRRADAATLARDLAMLAKNPALDTLHPGLKARLTRLSRTPNRGTLYGLPYSVAYADQMVRSHELLHQ